MQLAIVQNPHVKDPKLLWETLEAFDKKPEDEKLDKRGFEMLKQKLRNSSHVMVK